MAPGAYVEAIYFLGKVITLRSSCGPEVTTIDGTGHFHVVRCVSGEGSELFWTASSSPAAMRTAVRGFWAGQGFREA